MNVLHNVNNGLEIDVVYGCNQKCSQCAHYSHIQRGYVSVEEFVQWCEPWAKRLRTPKFNLIGGEPTLHPQLPTLVYEARRIWGDVELWVASNGRLPNKVTPELIEAMQKTGCKVCISTKPYKQMFGKEYIEDVKESLRLYFASGIETWIKHYELYKWVYDDLRKPVEYNVDEARQNCLYKSCAFPLTYGYLHQCTPMCYLPELKRKGLIDWADLEKYKPLTPDATDDEIQFLLNQKFNNNWCRWCMPNRPILYRCTNVFERGTFKLTQENVMGFLYG